MGDSICIQTEILREMGWGSGLTEDYELRLKMLLHGIKIDYEPNAIGYGQAPLNLKDAQAQQLRWARGFADAGKLYRKHLLRSGLQQLDWSKLDGVLRTFLPSYSTMALISIAMTLLHLIFSLNYIPVLVYAWGSLALLCFIYPLLGLAIIKAPSWSYVAILSGPFFMIWRTWIHIVARIAPHSKTWIRTPHNFDQTKDQPKNL
jgi:cellulose synthase/poly-beta-1,6-N-acetylglucosamine synthase-like glycosyltransferase